MKKGTLIIILAFFITVVLAGTVSAADATGDDQDQLAVTSITPADNAVDVPAGDSKVTITFNNPIQQGSAYYDDYILNTKDNSQVGITNSISGNTLTITPYTKWSQNTKYNVYIPADAVTDQNGNALTAPITSSFTTAPAITVTDTTPADNAVNVPTTNPSVTITFDSPIQMGSAYYDIYILNTTNNTHVNVTNYINGNKLTLIPYTNWLQNTTYNVYIPVNAVTDSDGNTIDAPFTSSFTTKSALIVNSIDPADNATNVSNTNKTITVTFNKPIHTESNYNGIYVMDCAYNSFRAITNSINGNVLTITADSNWTSSIYAIYIYPGAVVDEYGNTLDVPFYSTFSNTNMTYDSSIPSTGTPKPCVILTFDDTFVSHYYIAKPYLSGKGLNPTYFLNAGILGTGAIDDMLSEAQVLELAADGWLIANHTWDHTLLSTLTEAQQIAEITQNQAWILANTNGQGAYIFATPGGDANADTITAMANTGITFCRGNLSFGTIWNPNLDDGTQTILGLPMENFDIKDEETNTASEMLALIAQSLANNQSLIIVIHGITDTPQANSTDISTTEFQALIDGIVTNNYRCLNPYQWLNEWKLNGQNITVTSVNPANNASNVSITDKTITIKFSNSIKSGSAYNEIYVQNTTDNSHPTITKHISGNTLTLTASANWVAGTTYNIYIPANAVTDYNGNTLDSTYSNFTTLEGVAPTIVNTDPTNNAVNVPIDKVITVTFNEEIKQGSNFWIELKNSSGTAIPFTTSINGNVLTIDPTNNLAESKYKFILHTGCVTDLAGNPLAAKSSYFTVGTSPTITSTNPANGVTNVAPTKTITVTFNEAIKAGSNFWIELKNSSGTAIPFTKSISDKVLTINPTGNLAESKYKLSLHTGCVTDLAGNPLAAKSSYFTVGTSPTITSTSPANGATGVARNKVIKVTFSENIKAGSNYNIELVSSNGTSVTIGKSISGKVLTITHTTKLAANTKYYLKLHTGCVTDTAGNPLAAKTISFTTGST